MKKQISLILVIIFSIQFAFAQKTPNIKITWGSGYELPEKFHDIADIGDENGDVLKIFHSTKNRQLIFQRFNKLKPGKQEFIDLNNLPKDYTIEGVNKINNKNYLVFSTYLKGDDKEQLFFQEIDITSLKFVGNAIEIMSSKKLKGTVAATGVYRFASLWKYDMYFNVDTTKMTIVTQSLNKKKDDSKNFEKYNVAVFDLNFKKIWQKDFEMPFTEKKMDIIHRNIDYEGNIYFLARVFNDGSEKSIKENEINYHFEILKLSHANEKTVSIPFQFEDKNVSQIFLFSDLQNRLVCAGYYAGKNIKGQIKKSSYIVDGTFVLRIDTKNDKVENVNKNTYELPSEIFKQYISSKELKKVEENENKGKDLENSTLKLRKVFFDADGSVIIIGEEYYSYSYTVGFGKSQTTRTVFVYNDIIAQKILANGNIAWTTKIPKRQSSYSDFNMGFYVIQNSNGLNFIFVDNENNVNIDVNETPYSSISGSPLMNTFLNEKTGEISKNILFNTNGIKDVLLLDNSRQLDNNTLLIQKRLKKIFTLGLISTR